MRLYVDEDLASKELINRLGRAGHDALTLAKGLADEGVWSVAQQHGAAVLTMNASDFIALASSEGAHAGLLVVFAEGDATRDMKPADIAEAIDRIDKRHPAGLRDMVIVVNQHRS